MGLYDNELGCYVCVEAQMNAHWLTNESGALYIVCRQDSDETFETLGEDESGAIAFLDSCDDRVLSNPGSMAEAGFSLVPGVLRRFDRENGYHSV